MKFERAARLREAREIAGFETGAAAAARFGWKVSTYLAHENGQNGIKPQKIEEYASAFRVDPSWLLSGQTTNVTRVPLLTWVSAGRMATADGVTPIDVESTLSFVDLPRGDWIALRIDGDSMNRVAPHASVILVNKSEQALQDDRFYVFSTESGEATFKRYRSNPFRLQPFSTNPDHETIHPRENMLTVGRVRRVITDL
jgi:phage repressor protein C with HTH and peptisase S24 domain